MKITKSRLKQIIKEEVELSLDERKNLAAVVRNAIIKALEAEGRGFSRWDGAEVDNLSLQLVNLSEPNEQ
jgi:hypothetical protein